MESVAKVMNQYIVPVTLVVWADDAESAQRRAEEVCDDFSHCGHPAMSYVMTEGLLPDYYREYPKKIEV